MVLLAVFWAEKVSLFMRQSVLGLTKSPNPAEAIWEAYCRLRIATKHLVNLSGG